MSKNKGLQASEDTGETKKEISQRGPGRPPGSKNKTTLFKELMRSDFQDIAEQNIKKTFSVLFEKAHEGDMQAIKLIMDRVVPASKAIDMDELGKKGGLVINVNIGELEDSPLVTGEVIEDAEYTEVDDG